MFFDHKLQFVLATLTMSTEPTVSVCVTCREPKAAMHCGLCQNAICKKCTEAMGSDFFSFLKSVPTELSHPAYCGGCFDQHVALAKTAYLETMALADKVVIFYKKERNVPVARQSKMQLQVKDCLDRDETLLRLAFFAAQQKFNAVIHVELVPEKIRINGYQKTHWHATGFPAMLELRR